MKNPKLVLGSYHGYNQDQLKIIDGYRGREITWPQLNELARRVGIAISASESDDSQVAIVHPHRW